MSERLKIAIPNGQLEEGVLGVARGMGLEFQEPGREYFIPVRNMPIDFVVLRASDIPSFIKDDTSRIKTGITGSDILWEAGMGRSAGQELPYNGNPEFQPALFVGVTEEFAARIQQEAGRDPSPQDLSGHAMATKFPRIAGEYLGERAVSSVRINPVAGKIEAMQHVYWDCIGVLDVVESGKTREANGIRELERFYEVTVRMIEAADRLTPSEKGILEDLKEKIWIKRQELTAVMSV